MGTSADGVIFDLFHAVLYVVISTVEYCSSSSDRHYDITAGHVKYSIAVGGSWNRVFVQSFCCTVCKQGTVSIISKLS
jgi:hypothetical protein